ncbi:hypothetical protein PUR49_11220 [Streptomyces sp. BE147]|uniref:hypothetical protein n=1 Tax=Streptomyces sp. BE147 TaxID=3002524 RepID=UPI002E78916C|nr:hypothetical protein [Streptomyces sp. BE147]MEE1737066.1 hypothetical protein [Streptomyces sp. BE147]
MGELWRHAGGAEGCVALPHSQLDFGYDLGAAPNTVLSVSFCHFVGFGLLGHG